MVESTDAKSKYEGLVEEYSRKIAGGMPPGTYLPSIREMMRIHGVSLGTVQQALACLREMGLVVPRPRRGYMVVDRRPLPKAEREIGLAMVGGSEYLPHVINRLTFFMEAMAGSDPMDLRLWSGHKEQGDHLAEWAEKLDGLLLWGHVDSAMIAACAKRVSATVVIGNIDDGICPPTAGQVHYDVASAVSLAVNHLLGLGHRRIAAIHAQGYRTLVDAKAAVRELSREMDSGALTEIALPVALEEVECGDLLDALQALPELPTAFIPTESRVAIALLDALEAMGLRIPEDASMVKLGGPFFPKEESKYVPTCVHRGNREMAQRAMEMLQEMLGGAPPSRQMMQPVLFPGETAAPPPKQRPGWN